MAKSARMHVFEGMEMLPEALGPFVEKRLESSLSGHWQVEVAQRLGLRPNGDGHVAWDQQGLLKAMMSYWREAFGTVLGHAERSHVSELLEVRNKLSHNEKFTYDDAERALDTMRRLLQAVSAGKAADEIEKKRDTILRVKFTEVARAEQRRDERLDLSVEAQAGLRPWREVVEPHPDVATGEFTQAEFAADLGKVAEGKGPSEYSDPAEFFARTYLTGGLSNLLLGAAKRLCGTGGDPVVELQANFGGGKTHSMLALYHMAGETPAGDLPGLDGLLQDAGLGLPDKVSRAVLVGTARGPQDPIEADGLTIRTSWGELAWQLGGADGYAMVRENDEKGIAPGSTLLGRLFEAHAPCLILIDEWVAYLRQIYKVDGLPAGSFDANLSFVQSLTEAVKASPRTLLVASLPASQIEVGGEGGQEALSRLKQTFSRVESSWRSASQEESYEIVRRRLFQQIPGDLFHHRDNAIKQFAKLYRESPDAFPQGTGEADYRRKLEAAYPIHPELFDQLYATWGSLEKFQRTRGVLRLMAQVIHELWMGNDPSIMIMPGSVAVGSARVEPELLHYLDPSWSAIIAGDVDGTSASPYRIDQEAPRLNRYSATRRVARAVFMATAPVQGQDKGGVDGRQINLGVVQPGEQPAVFGDALRRLANKAKFLHADMDRYWYSMSASLNRTAADRAAELDDATITERIDADVRAYVEGLADRGHFAFVQAVPSSSADVPDEAEGVRAVVLGVKHSHNGRDGSAAMKEARDIFLHRGNGPRVNRNALVFLAADERQVDGLREAVRMTLAWTGILRDKDRLNLPPSDETLAKAKSREAEETARARLRETWCHVLYPAQDTPTQDVEWESAKVQGQAGLLSGASKRLVSEEALFTDLGAQRLQRVLKDYIWNGQAHLRVVDVWDYANRYVYMPRLKDRAVLRGAIERAVSELDAGPFAFAERYDEANGQYVGLVVGGRSGANIVLDGDAVIVEQSTAQRHRPAASPQPAAPFPVGPDGPTVSEPTDGPKPDTNEASAGPRRFSGTVLVPADRPFPVLQKIMEGIIDQLTDLPDCDVTIRLEIEADVPSGLNRAKVRTLIENATTIGFVEKSVH